MKAIAGMTTETVAGTSYAPHWVGYAIVAAFVLIVGISLVRWQSDRHS